MARFGRYERFRRDVLSSFSRCDFPEPKWAEDGESFTFVRDKKYYRFDFATGTETRIRKPRSDRRTPERGRQYDTVFSPDRSQKAFHRDRNVYIARADGTREHPVTTTGSAADRTRFGSASWVYGEEIGLKEAMLWSPDGAMLAFYGFDEKEVRDFFLTLDETKQYTKLDVEAYPKAGTPNPKVELFVYHLEDGRTVRVDTGFPSDVADIDHYVYNAQWSPNGSVLLFNRTNRLQNAMEWCEADPETGACRVIVREDGGEAWTTNTPETKWIDEASARVQRYLWVSERTGFRNIYLGTIGSQGLTPVTQHPFDVVSILHIDRESGRVYYSARSTEAHTRVQLHAVGLDGKGEMRLSDPSNHHTVSISPDGQRMIDTSESLDEPPSTRELRMDGSVVTVISRAKGTDGRRRQKVEQVRFLAADGETECWGYLVLPSYFDPSQRYPLVVSVYGGPESGLATERFVAPNALAELGFIVAWFDGRGTAGRGRAFRTSVYRRLGIVEIDDQAAAVRSLSDRPYVDLSRVGVYGTSYGGYATLMCMLRYPDVFHAGIAASSVTQWTNYDSIYTERYMSTPEDNPEGYRLGSTLTHAKNLRGRLLLFYGTADNNVHPANTHQLIKEFNRLGKRYEVMVAPDKGHIAPPEEFVARFFCDALLARQESDPLRQAIRRARRHQKPKP